MYTWQESVELSCLYHHAKFKRSPSEKALMEVVFPPPPHHVQETHTVSPLNLGQSHKKQFAHDNKHMTMASQACP